MLEPGARVAGYRVERQLGDNSLAGTWLVTDPEGRSAVLRVLLLLVPAYQERFRRSAELLRHAAHPHLVRRWCCSTPPAGRSWTTSRSAR
jgi:hypothetical protein